MLRIDAVPTELSGTRDIVPRMRIGGLMRWDDLTVENIYKWDSWLHKIKPCEGESTAGMGCIGEAVYNYHRLGRCCRGQ